MSIFINKEVRYWCWSWIFFLKDHFFQEACKQHDIDYVEWIKDRAVADRDFYNNMLNLAKWNYFRIISATIFYIIVRLVWGLFFKKTNDST